MTDANATGRPAPHSPSLASSRMQPQPPRGGTRVADLAAAESLRRFRRQFPVDERSHLPLERAVTPAADPVRHAVSAWVSDWVADRKRTYDDLEPQMARLRATVAKLIGAPEGTIALTLNTSHGSNIAVRGLSDRPGTDIVADQGTYSSSSTRG